MATNQQSHHQSTIIDFFDPAVEGPLPASQATLSKVVGWSDEKLEYVHNFIQWLFPLPESSAFSSSAETLTKADYDAFHSRPELQARLRDGLRRMCGFYGLDLLDLPNEEGMLVVKGKAFDRKAKYTWLCRNNHNHNRISRALSFALALFEADTKAIVNDTARAYWCRAALWPLEEAPDGKNRCTWLANVSDGATNDAMKTKLQQQSNGAGAT
ncbi:hypothetical protein BAUCODRAFT_573567 [Baudoinia panamericana UAMH 10762]|uniref:Opioid growth factor receptor (OGFr) conserved domain-containing protein n=1 Tax=Baudoinia panamericana (strain UAMH 10762) TaxID=717646 RepID=M2NJE3_BAUPA|nr:uncharacterized protein BAUCODRAFT_573567 [Baudoinia panamericana UAMH 10762]EMC99265.1 hypothetical protein BAUCODRAFT_573567 [Baudoinia panamericana UAMH 10762]